MTGSMYGIRPHRQVTAEEAELMRRMAEQDEARFREQFWARQHEIIGEKRRRREACGY
jgi:hypothetical protein